MKLRNKPPDLSELTGPKLLRLLVQVNCSILATWCPRCCSWLVKDTEKQADQACPRCGGVRVILNDQFWNRVSDRIKRAIRRDKMLLRTVKMEWESIREGNPMLQAPSYPFPKPLSWLKDAWTKAAPPSNRPVQAGHFYRLSFMIERFRDIGLTQTEILDVLGNPEFHDGTVKVGRKNYANIPGEVLRELSRIFRRCIGDPPDAAELWRIMRWVRRQRESLLVRLSGERVKQTKVRGAEKNLSNGRLTGALLRPTEQDWFRFKMVSALVRQEGLPKGEAVERLAERHGLGDKSDEIHKSLDRVWQYVAKCSGNRMPEPEKYWQPGVLRVTG